MHVEKARFAIFFDEFAPFACLLGSPGGKRCEESLAAQGCRTHRACRWVRNKSQRAAALRHHLKFILVDRLF